MPAKLTTEQFIENARAVHGDRYDYSNTQYVNARTKVTIYCPHHGPFQQLPSTHIRNHGCPDCANARRSASLRQTREDFIEQAKAAHGDRYDYSKVVYINNYSEVTIVCPDHGPFKQVPSIHVRNHGCPDCGSNKLTTESFIALATAIHGDRYDYSSVDYVRSNANVTITCQDHGPFMQTPNSHLSMSGCPDCGGRKQLTTDTFIEKAKAIHGSRYNYSKVRYVNNVTRVTIICPDHGPFEQIPSNHIHIKLKTGCPDCADSGFNPNEPAVLYYLAITTDDGDTRYKIGITNRTVETRFRPPDLARIRKVKTWRYAIGRAAAEREAEILRQYSGERYYGPDILLSGNTELFTHDILRLDRGDKG